MRLAGKDLKNSYYMFKNVKEQEHKKNDTKKLQMEFLEMKNSVSKVKKYGSKSRQTLQQDRSVSLKTTAIKTIQTEAHREKETKTNRSTDLWDTIK